MTDGIIPAAGLASRMRGLPKFLLPCDEYYTTLLEKHVSSMLDVCETVWIPTRPEQTILIAGLGLPSERVVMVPMTTHTMTETVIRLCSISGANRFLMVMPDTYFLGEQPYSYLAHSSSPMDLACWNIRPEQAGKLGQVLIDEDLGSVTDAKDKEAGCQFRHSWGAMSFDRSVLDCADAAMPHTGYMIPKLLQARIQVQARVMDGRYFDCGTPREYLDMLSTIS